MAKAGTKIAAASLSAGGSGAIGRLDPRAIEKAMSEAVEAAYAKGVTDPDKILKLKLAAREQVKAEFRAAEKAEIAKVQAAATKKGN